MPMIDLFAPQGALPANGLTTLTGSIVEAVHVEEGYTGSRFAASVSWTYVHEMSPGPVAGRQRAVPRTALARGGRYTSGLA